MEIASKNENRMRIVSVKEPRIDAAVAIEFKDAMRVQIVAALKHLGQDKQLAIAGLTPTVARVFQLTRMDSVFSLYPTLDGALTALGNE